MNDELVTLFDAFYSKFVLRDFLAKIVPGSMLVSAIAISLTSFPFFLNYVSLMSYWFWIAGFGIAWIATFAVQSFAEKYNFIQYYPVMEGLDQKGFYEKQIKFNQISSISEKQQVERFVVIKEACGNSYVTLSISLLLLMTDGILDTIRNEGLILPWIQNELFQIHVLIVLIGAIYFLRKMHFIHVIRQYEYLLQVIESKNNNK